MADKTPSSPKSLSVPLAGVSRETEVRLHLFKAVFDQWQSRINLVAPSTLAVFWERHVADSAQLHGFAPDVASWLDLGSGGGFPGLVIAAIRSEAKHQRTILVESNAKKAAFLREAARQAGIRAEILAERLETVVPRLTGSIDVVSARALAPLTQLVAWSLPLLKTGALGLYLKGRDATSEIEALGSPAHLRLARFPSRIDPESSVVAAWMPDQCPGPTAPAATY
jgi:16S rRNA (guanine527-N7)-methyltransferase